MSKSHFDKKNLKFMSAGKESSAELAEHFFNTCCIGSTQEERFDYIDELLTKDDKFVKVLQ